MSGRRACVFCAGTPLTLEHNPPRWLNEYCDDLDHGGTRVVFKHRGELHPRGGSRTVTATVGRVVCDRCNNGWMSELECRTKDMLGPMTQGHGTRLGVTQQDTLGAWLVKSSLVHAAMSSWENTALFADAFRRFFEHRAATLPWFVHVAAHGGKEQEFIQQYFAKYSQNEGVDRAKGMSPAYIYTMMIGHFVGTVTYSYDMTFPRPDTPPLTRIAPRSRSFIWPRGRYMTLDDVDALGSGPSADDLAPLLAR